MVNWCIRRGQRIEHPAELRFLIHLLLSILKAFFEVVVNHVRRLVAQPAMLSVGFFHRLDHQATAVILSGFTDCKVIEGNIGIGVPTCTTLRNKKANAP